MAIDGKPTLVKFAETINTSSKIANTSRIMTSHLPEGKKKHYSFFLNGLAIGEIIKRNGSIIFVEEVKAWVPVKDNGAIPFFTGSALQLAKGGVIVRRPFFSINGHFVFITKTGAMDPHGGCTINGNYVKNSREYRENTKRETQEFLDKIKNIEGRYIGVASYKKLATVILFGSILGRLIFGKPPTLLGKLSLGIAICSTSGYLLIDYLSRPMPDMTVVRNYSPFDGDFDINDYEIVNLKELPVKQKIQTDKNPAIVIENGK